MTDDAAEMDEKVFSGVDMSDVLDRQVIVFGCISDEYVTGSLKVIGMIPTRFVGAWNPLLPSLEAFRVAVSRATQNADHMAKIWARLIGTTDRRRARRWARRYAAKFMATPGRPRRYLIRS